MSGVKSRREQYSEATRTALLDAATRRFAEHGFAGTSLEDVATDIQATRGAVYHHFPSKTALFQAAFERQEAEMIQGVVAAGASAATPRAAAEAALDEFLDRTCDPVYSRLVWREAPMALGWQRWKECEEKYAYGLVEQITRSLMDSGDLPVLPLEPLARITFHLMGAAGLAVAEASEEDRPRVKAEYAQVLKRMMSGMRDSA